VPPRLSPAVLLLLTTAAAAEDGERVFQKCFACHSVVEGENNLPGPNLRGVVGRKAATLAGFDFSPALAGSGLVWDDTTLDRFLADPLAAVPGTSMSFPGLRRPEERRAVIAYLRGFPAE
jgi:cytochrome c